jgi:hypothetical protein
MSKVVSPVTVRVEVIGKPKESTFQPGQYYYPTLFIDLSQPEGAESAKIWKSLSGDEVSQICKGDVVQLVPAGQDKNGREKHNIVISAAANPSQNLSKDFHDRTISKSVDIDADTKRAIATYIVSQSDLYRFCYQTAQTKLDGFVDDLETTRCMATTLYLGAVRKFGLDR